MASTELTEAGRTTPGFPSGGRAWRILYVTSGLDEDQLQLVCGQVAAPTDGPRVDDSTARMLLWAHGTVGVAQDCLPSNDPAKSLWGPMPGGINAIGWGADLGKHEGDPAGGMLQYALDEGWVVAASDYQPEATYIVGSMEAAATLDAARAATQLMAQVFGSDAPPEYESVVTGHSQGGHTALWTGQLAETYLAKIEPSRPTAAIELVGVAALAPASNFITQPGQPGTSLGDGLGDWEMHKNIGLDLPIEAVQLQIGSALFSYIIGSWHALAGEGQPGLGAAFPANPATDVPLDLASVITAQGSTTVDAVMPLCLTGDDAKQVQSLVSGYGDATTMQMLVPQLWNLPESYRSGEFFHGGLDAACAEPADAGLSSWCAWLRWNLPGPLGVNPYPRVPSNAGELLPVFLAQGMNDDFIHCQPPTAAGSTELTNELPDAADCMSRALYDSLADSYSPAGEAEGYLRLDGVRPAGVGGVNSPATHLSVRGEIAARDISGGADGLVFESSSLQEFLTAAFDRSRGALVLAGCCQRDLLASAGTPLRPR